MLLRIENYARIFGQNTEPVDYYATVWCENMADRSATSSTAIQGDVASASESMEPVDNPANSEIDSDSIDSPVVSHVVSLLDRLKAPTPSDLARKRKIACNPPPKGKKRSCGRGANNPKSVTPIQRVKEHPDECLTVSNKQLFCRACREELSLISSVVHNHVKSAKHHNFDVVFH